MNLGLLSKGGASQSFKHFRCRSMSSDGSYKVLSLGSQAVAYSREFPLDI
jgi:hypothetical protein